MNSWNPKAKLTLFLLPLLVALMGCAKGRSIFIPERGFNDGTAGWTGNLRTQAGNPASGLSSRAREIERNLGMPD